MSDALANALDALANTNAELDKARRELAAAIEILDRVEWMAMDASGASVCPECWGGSDDMEHADDCRLAAMIEAKRGR